MSSLLLGTLATSANAEFQDLLDLSSFSGNEELIDFAVPGAVQGDRVPVINGVSFTLIPSEIAPRFSNQDSTVRPFGPQGIEAIDAFVGPIPYDDLMIEFPDPVNRVGFVINANDGNTVDVRLFSDGFEFDVYQNVIGPGFNFIGFEADDPMEKIVIEVGNSLGFGFWRIDNLRYESFDVDTDGDGVNDNDDLCPDTPPGVSVDADGWPARGR